MEKKTKVILVYAIIVIALTLIITFVVIKPFDKGEAILPGDLIEDNDPLLGNINASVSIIEFSDFQCPYCKTAYATTLVGLKNSSYFTEGKVNLIYKQMPLVSIHPWAQKAAEASLCAQEQEKFWEYHNLLFENQDALNVSDLKQYAPLFNMDQSQFDLCLDSNKYAEEVASEVNLGTSLGISGTPTFIIVNKETGKAVSVAGAYPWESFQDAIKEVQ